MEDLEQQYIELTDDNGEAVRLEVIEETRINGVNYLLAADGDEAYIFKDVSSAENAEAEYEPVEEEEEIAYIARIFEELMDDIELE